MSLRLSRSGSSSLLAAAALLAAGACLAAPQDVAAAQARASDSVDSPRNLPDINPRRERKADRRALSAAVRRVKQATRGQVLSAERVPFDGRDVNRIKVVDDRGRVRVYWDDPQTQRSAAPRNDARRPAPRRQGAVAGPDTPRTRRDDSDDPRL